MHDTKEIWQLKNGRSHYVHPCNEQSFEQGRDVSLSIWLSCVFNGEKKNVLVTRCSLQLKSGSVVIPFDIFDRLTEYDFKYLNMFREHVSLGTRYWTEIITLYLQYAFCYISTNSVNRKWQKSYIENADNLFWLNLVNASASKRLSWICLNWS